MNSMQGTFDEMFGDSSKYDLKYETFNTENNPITASIDVMSEQIFETEKAKDKNYEKQKNKVPQN